ncbi:protein Smaug homolog 1-like [Ptychodera flava]|uniref:protein Smaug homolog 1-like n=1 Tax=Ptychodera flava TaxID=63121 RepID=UPI003969EC2C
MKPSTAFRDQVRSLSICFKEWSDCEQTVALYSLLSRLSATQARFLSFVLEQTVSDSQELKLLEQQANDPGYISSLGNESKENAVAQLLGHLPLLHPGNDDAKTRYLELIPKILRHSIENSIHLEESRQLLSYSVIHPALNEDERSSLTQWLTHLDECTSSSYHHPQLRNLCSDPTAGGSIPSGLQVNSFDHNVQHQYVHCSKTNGWRNFGDSSSGLCENTEQTITLVPGHRISESDGMVRSHPPVQLTLSAPPAMNLSAQLTNKAGTSGNSLVPPSRNKRSNSLTPPMSTQGGIPIDTWVSTEDVGRGNSVTNEHAPLSPQSSIGSTGEPMTEDTSSTRNTFLEEGSGMKDVPAWLKSLRLHKYSALFQQMTYEEMMTLTEEKLEARNVTKGARNKIILSIRKLTERQQTLRDLEKEIMECTSPSTLRHALNELKSILMTPLKLYTISANNSPTKSDTVKLYTISANNSPTKSDTAETTVINKTMTTVTVTNASETQLKMTSQGNADISQSSAVPNESEPSSVPIIEGDIPGQFTRVMGKVCTHLLVSRHDEDNLNMYFQLIDKACSHEAFTETQKKRFMTWKVQCQKQCRTYPRRLSLDSKQRGGWMAHGNTFPADYIISAGSNVPVRRGVGPRQQFSQPTIQRVVQGSGAVGSNNSSLGITSVISRSTTNQGATGSFLNPRSGNAHQSVQRTKSAPVRRPSPQLGSFMIPQGRVSSDFQFGVTEPEINNRLESLCLSVTEHALSDGPGGDRTSTL